MHGKTLYLTLLAFVLGLGAGSSGVYGQPGLIGYWKFDEASGSTASDASGGGKNGTLGNGAVLQPGAGVTGGALFVDPADASGYCEIPTGGMKVSGGTLMVWAKLANPQPVRTAYFFGHTTQPVWASRIQLYTDGADNLLDLGLGDSHATRTGIADLALETWYHIALTWNAGSYTVYLDGAQLAAGTYGGLNALYPIMDIGNDGHDQRTRTEAFGGLLDEMKIFDRALVAAEIQQAMIAVSPGAASEPSPDDEATDVSRDVVLSWTPGEYVPAINGHRVYFGENYNDVNDGIGGITQSTNSYDPGRLDFETTYYWRVDEVNAPPDSTVFKGEVWSFSTESVSYPVDGANITVTACSSSDVAFGPEKTIDGSGLDANGGHSTEPGDMWISDSEPQGAWIQYEFDKVYKLHEMWVWNSNQIFEHLFGFGFRNVTVEYSINGIDWTTLANVPEFAQATGKADYGHNTTVDLGGVAAKYIKLTATSNWGGSVQQYSLSEVRFLYIPVSAREPDPASGATDIAVDAALGWRAGREAANHNVYLSTDDRAVTEGTAPVVTVTSPAYATSLDLNSTYYWRIDEVNEAEVPSTWQGDLWSFSTQEYLVVDAFESYNDIPNGQEGSNLVYETWVDGFANPTTNGSTIGYAEAFQPSMETATVYDGKQSVPLVYNNTAASISEITANVAKLQAGTDWARHGIKGLTLRFYGDPNNVPQQIYVKVNSAKVTYDGSAENLMLKGWQMWYIDLASLGVNLSNVSTLTIGFERIGGLGGQGIVLLDGLRLYSYDRQLVTPADPGTAGLQAQYQFEGNTSDSSGNRRNGTAQGGPAFSAGRLGQAISLDGFNDYVNIDGYKGILGSSAVTVTAWIRTNSTVTGAIVGWGPNVAGQRFGFRVDAGRLRLEHHGGNIQGDTVLDDGDWHHVAVTVQAGATISYPETILYLDGVDDTRPTADPDVFNLTAAEDVSIGRRPASNDRFFLGQIDEVHIYNRALTHEEVGWLSGRTKPFDKPF